MRIEVQERGGHLMKKSIRNLALLVSGVVIMFAFQNCGQPGSLSEASSSLSKSDSPLVVDVVAEMENQLPPTQANTDEAAESADEVDEVKDYDKKDEKKESTGHIRHRELVDEDDVVYNNELENVLKDHSCQDNGRDNARKILVCHYPPGNSAARHEICISRQALRAHMHQGADSNHQDRLGACPAESEE